MGDYLEKFYKRNMSIEELVRHASNNNIQDQLSNQEEEKYETIVVNYLNNKQILFLFFYFLGILYFLSTIYFF